MKVIKKTSASLRRKVQYVQKKEMEKHKQRNKFRLVGLKDGKEGLDGVVKGVDSILSGDMSGNVFEIELAHWGA